MTLSLFSSLLHLFFWTSLGNLGLLGEGTQIQLALPNLTRVLDTAVIDGQVLQLEAALEPLASVVLLISPNANADEPPEVVTLNGFISPTGDDIMVRSEGEGEPVSLRGWLRTMQDITFILHRQ